MLRFTSSHESKPKPEPTQKRAEFHLISEQELRQRIDAERKKTEEESQMQQITSKTAQLKI